jgi:hypothetical protein
VETTARSPSKSSLLRALGAGLAALLALLPSGLLVAGTTGTGVIQVRIASSANPVDAALPFELTSDVVSPVSEIFYNWTDSLGGTNHDPTWELDVDVPGNLTVVLQVTTGTGYQGAASLTLQVVPSPSVSLSSPLAYIDAGVPAPLFVHVAGGVPPLAAVWTPDGGGSSGATSWPIDGNYSEEVNFSYPGPGWVHIRVVDALGVVATDDQIVTEVEPLGSFGLASNGSVGEVGWPLGIAVVAEGGAPPFRWFLSSSLPFTGGEGSVGDFASDGTYRWNLSFAFSGVALLNLTMIDAVGELAVASTLVTVEPPLSIDLTGPGQETSTRFDVVANVSGGLAPYHYELRLSDGERFNGTLDSAGFFSTAFDPGRNGNYSVEVRVTDSLGQTSVSTATLRVNSSVTPAADPPTSNLSPYAGGAILTGICLLAAALYLYHRFRRTPGVPPTPENSALPAVRQLMQQSQIIDRDTLLLLCEEAGESSEAAQAALKTLVRTGEVTCEPGPAHDEVLRWKGFDPTATPTEDPP